MGGHSSSPPPISIPPPIPQIQMPNGAAASDAVTKRAAGAVGPAATILTGPQGLTMPATTSNKTLLGS